MQMIQEKQIIDLARFQHLEGHEFRPAGEIIELVVIHNYDEFIQWQVEPEKPSIHISINRDGSLVQNIPFSKRAIHSGSARFQDRTNVDDFSIAIALRGDAKAGYTDAQYQQLALLLNVLIKQFPQINLEQIVSHSDISTKEPTGPGPHFHWGRLHELMTSNKEVL